MGAVCRTRGLMCRGSLTPAAMDGGPLSLALKGAVTVLVLASSLLSFTFGIMRNWGELGENLTFSYV